MQKGPPRIKKPLTHSVIYIALCDLKSSISRHSASKNRRRAAPLCAVTQVRAVQSSQRVQRRRKGRSRRRSREDGAGKNREKSAGATGERGRVCLLAERNPLTTNSSSSRRRHRCVGPLREKPGKIMPPSWMLVNIPRRKRSSSRARDPAWAEK